MTTRIPKKRTKETTRKDLNPAPLGEKPLVIRAQVYGHDGQLYDVLIGLNESGISVRGHRGSRVCHAEWPSILKFCTSVVEDRFGGVTGDQWESPLTTIARPVQEPPKPVAF